MSAKTPCTNKIRSRSRIKAGKYLLSIALLSLLLFYPGGNLVCQSLLPKPDPAIFQKWLYSYEEDSNSLKTYRPASFDYPLGFGRPGMKFTNNGCFVLYEFGPNDQPVQIHGLWTPISKKRIKISFPGGEKESFMIEIKELNTRILKIVKL